MTNVLDVLAATRAWFGSAERSGDRLAALPRRWKNLLVFYLPSEAEWQAAVARLEQAGYYPVVDLKPVLGSVGPDIRGSRRLPSSATVRELASRTWRSTWP